MMFLPQTPMYIVPGDNPSQRAFIGYMHTGVLFMVGKKGGKRQPTLTVF